MSVVILFYTIVSRDSEFEVATGYRLEDQGVKIFSNERVKYFLHSRSSGAVPGPNRVVKRQ
jgi:hypothetical protein